MAILALCLACLLPQDPPARAGAAAGDVRVRWWEDRLAELERPDARHETFGSVGRRLWLTRDAAAPGLRGQAHWLHHTPELDGLFAIELQDRGGAAVEPSLVRRAWRPTDNLVEHALGDGGRLVEQRWITPDDVAVVQAELHGPFHGRVQVTSRWTPQPAGDPARFAPAPLGARASVDLWRDRALRRGDPDAGMFVEAERPLAQHGSTGRDRKPAASGGEVLGADFGGKRGHRASWRFAGDGRDGWVLLARYARAAESPARWQVAIDGVEAGALDCAPTGGWGSAAGELRWATLALPALPDAPFELSLQAGSERANTNFDALLLLRAEQAADPPPPERWPALDPLRGILPLRAGTQAIAGIPFELAGTGGAHAVPAGSTIAVGGTGALVHLLALSLGPDAELACGGGTRLLPASRGAQVVTFVVAPDAAIDVVPHDCLLLAITREAVDPTAPRGRRGRDTWHGTPTELHLTVTGLPADGQVALGAEQRLRFVVALEFCGGAPPGVATAAALAGADPLAAHRRREAEWYARHCPRLVTGDPRQRRLWTYRCFLLRHNLAEPRAGHLTGGPVFYEGRHGSWYPRVITFSTPHIVAEARWLADPTLWRGNVEAHLRHLAADGELPNLLVDWAGFRYSNWIGAAVVDALAVHPDRAWAQAWFERLVRNTEGIATLYDRDDDGVLCTGDHYTTGMEFQPSFWFHSGFDNRQRQTDLERPDLTSYAFGNATALATAARWLGDEPTAARLDALAARLRDATLRKLWHAEDRFFYSIREADDSPARVAEVVGFYPFRFRLPPDEPPFRAALERLVDPAQFWTAFPVASCSKQTPVYSPAVQRWPGPGGLVTACMWNGPTWPHANSLAIDALANGLTAYGESRLRPEHLGELLHRFAAFHFEGTDPGQPLLREYGDGETGVNWGCADYLHSTWLDLMIRHVFGLQPRLDGAIELRPLAPGFGDLAIEDVPYHGHRLAIRRTGGDVELCVDDRLVARGPAARGLLVEPPFAAR